MAALFGRRFFSTTFAFRNVIPDLATPAPPNGTAGLITPELKALGNKAQGSWSQLTKEETLTLYRASFPMSLVEIARNEGSEAKNVTIGLVIGLIASSALMYYLQTYRGPEKPHTYKNRQWEEDTRKKLIKQKANPVEGLSSRL